MWNCHLEPSRVMLVLCMDCRSTEVYCTPVQRITQHERTVWRWVGLKQKRFIHLPRTKWCLWMSLCGCDHASFSSSSSDQRARSRVWRTHRQSQLPAGVVSPQHACSSLHRIKWPNHSLLQHKGAENPVVNRLVVPLSPLCVLVLCFRI